MASTSRKLGSDNLAKDKGFYVLPNYLRQKIDAIIATDISKHYTTFKIPKRKSGFRTINAPDDELKAIQKDLLDKLQELAFRLPYWVSGFSPKRSIATNALEHRFIKYIIDQDTDYHKILGKQQRFFKYSIKHLVDIPKRSIKAPKSMIKMDIKDAFDSIGETLIKRGWPKKLRLVEEDFDRIIKLCLLNGCLPQGAPTSPFLLNIGLLPLDYYSRNLINRYLVKKGYRSSNFNYTRYADDITISVDRRQASELIGFVMGAARTLGLFIKKSKTRKMSRKFGMFVTGISVHNADTHITVSRRKRANIRAKIFNYHKNGGSVKDLDSIIGHIVHINSLDNGHGSALLEYAIKLGVLNREQNIGGFSAEQRVLTGKDIRNTRFQYFTKNKIKYEDDEKSYEQSEQEYQSVF